MKMRVCFGRPALWLALLWGVPAAVAQDGFEPDNLPAQANQLANGEMQTHTIYPARDVDFVRFEVTGNGAHNLEVTSNNGTDLMMWDSNFGLIGQGRGNGPGGISQVTLTFLAAGTYYAEIYDYEENEINGYQVSVTWTPATLAPDAYEADDSRSLANVIQSGRAQNRTIHAPGDQDWARFRIGTAGARNLQIDTGSSDVQAWLIRGRDNQGLGYADPHYTGNRVIALTSLAAGTYFIKVLGHSTTAMTAYRLSARWTANIPTDAYEPDNSRAAAKTIRNGQSQRRTIHRAGNRDWAKFTIGGRGARNLLVETRGASGDTEIWIYKSSGVRMLYDDDSGFRRFSRITAPAVPAGTYYIRVQEKGNDGTIAAYTLKASWTAR